LMLENFDGRSESVSLMASIGSDRTVGDQVIAHVRFGSEADMCAATGHVRFTPNSDRESGHAANGHVCFTPNSGHVQCTSSCLLWAKSGHSYYRETERDRQPRPNRGIKLLTAAGCDLTATRAAALDLQQADELARVFSKSNTKRPTGSADLVRSPDTSRSSRQCLDIPGIQKCACRDPARQARYMQATSVTCKVRKRDDR
jgi:hypothetical protein